MKENIAETISTVFAHLMSLGPSFPWWEIYAYWGAVVLIFVVDNGLRMKYNSKLKAEHDEKLVDMDKRMDAAQFEIKCLKHEVQWYIMRDGGVGSVMDIKDYKVRFVSATYSTGETKVQTDTTDFKYGTPLLGNVPTLGE